MAQTIEINILGNTQREQWHTVINCLKYHMNGNSGYPLLDELHRYVDWAEDMADKIRKEQKNGSNDSSER